MRSRILTTIDQCKPVDQTTTPCRPKVYSTSELPNINTSKFFITAADILWLRFGKGFLSLGTFSCYWPRAYPWHKLGALYSFDWVWLKYILPSVYPWLKWPLSFICSKLCGVNDMNNWRTLLIFCIFCVRFGRSQLCPQILLIAHAFLLALSYLRWNDSLK